MDNSQIQHLFKTDKYLKKYTCKCLLETELPQEIPPQHIFLILIKSKKVHMNTKTGQKAYLKGHWILLESLSRKKGKSGQERLVSEFQISYTDPIGNRPSKFVYMKMKSFQLKYRATLFINSTCFQLKYSSICGPISCYIALLRARGFVYPDIVKNKLSSNLKYIVKWLPEFLAPLLEKKNAYISRFSFDLLLA